MKDLKSLLTEADPLAGAPELPADEALAMRRAVIAAARVGRTAKDPWPGAVAIAALVVVTVAAGVAVGRRLPAAERPDTTVLAAPDERRQLHFSTPGGTRIIWTLDPEFELRRGTP